MRYFLTVAKYQHITRAAEEISVSQPALTQTVRRLEEELGVELFVKSGRNILLTEEGRILQDKARQLLAIIDELPSTLRQSKEARDRTVRICIKAASLLVIKTILAFRKLHPDVKIDLIKDDNPAECDFFVSAVMPDEKVPHGTFCIEEEIMLAVPTSRKDEFGEKVGLGSLKNEKFLSVDKGKAFYRISENYCHKAGFYPDTAFECDSLSAVLDLVAAGLGVGFFPAFSWDRREHTQITLVHLDDKPTRNITVTSFNNEQSAARKAFFDYLVKEMKRAKSRLLQEEE